MYPRAMLFALLLLSTPGAALRKTSSQGHSSLEARDEHNTTSDTSRFLCSDYCLKCGDGSTVWYGRSRDWTKISSAATGSLAMMGMAAFTCSTMGIPLVVGTSVGAVTRAVGDIGDEEVEPEDDGAITHTHWSGNIPTMGFFCEHHDVYKFPYAENGEQKGHLLMSSDHGFNYLKPYEEDANVTDTGFVDGDLPVYKEGCKVVKGSGMRGWRQMLPGATTKAVKMCSMHSKICGNVLDDKVREPEIVEATDSATCASLSTRAPVE